MDITIAVKDKDPKHPSEKDKSKWEWVSMPETDIFDKPQQKASINGIDFERGNRYFMPPDWATELRRIIKTTMRADMRIMQATPDVKSVRETPAQGGVDSTFIRQ